MRASSSIRRRDRRSLAQADLGRPNATNVGDRDDTKSKMRARMRDVRIHTSTRIATVFFSREGDGFSILLADRCTQFRLLRWRLLFRLASRMWPDQIYAVCARRRRRLEFALEAERSGAPSRKLR